ncbi:contractile injection system tape measure protein [Echinicola sp. 20G]|uniref:contractile injection system tape measure protein n=1 Tax=Echinicola sp. 20G TaxID=2781961 RepID=UPI00190FC776|nr:contractile injection system tape measure protein [Echinicola sp. 20G]
MHSAGQHIIHKVYLEIGTADVGYAHHLKDHISDFLQEVLFPKLESYFDQLASQFLGNTLQLDQVKVEISDSDQLHLVDISILVNDKVKKIIETKLAKMTLTEERSEIVISEEVKRSKAFFHFFDEGTQAWWNLEKEIFIPLQEYPNGQEYFTPAFKSELRLRLLDHSFRERLIKQLDNRQLQFLLSEAGFFEIENLLGSQDIDEHLNKLNKSQNHGIELNIRLLFWRILISQAINEPGEAKKNLKAKLVHLLLKGSGISPTIAASPKVKNYVSSEIDQYSTKKLISELPLLMDSILEYLKLDEALSDKKAIDQNIENLTKEPFSSDPNDGILPNSEQHNDIELIVPNAGLVLVHPFLKQLLINCDLLDDHNNLIDPESTAHLLHYIATKEEYAYEHQMVFEKYLVNIPSPQSIHRLISLSDSWKEQVEEMLEALLSHWPALKNSSTDLLRNEFLQRSGKLILKEGSSKLIMERKTHDILLEKIAWNISLVKLPWKEQLLFVEW